MGEVAATGDDGHFARIWGCAIARGDSKSETAAFRCHSLLGAFVSMREGVCWFERRILEGGRRVAEACGMEVGFLYWWRCGICVFVRVGSRREYGFSLQREMRENLK